MAQNDKSSIEQKIKQVLVEQLDVEASKIKPNALLREDLKLDSFGAVELIFNLQESFGFQIPDEDIIDKKTVGDMIDYIYTRLSGIGK